MKTSNYSIQWFLSQRRYAIIQQGQCIWGVGDSIEECILDANLLLDDDEEITGFEPGDVVGKQQSGLTFWVTARRYQSTYDLYITADTSLIAKYTPKYPLTPKVLENHKFQLPLHEIDG